MRTITIYICEICNFSSKNEDDVLKCEAQGRDNNFSTGQEVEFKLRYRPFPFNSQQIEEKWVRARIKRVLFAKKTHQVRYVIEPAISPSREILTGCTVCVGWVSRHANEDELRAISAISVSDCLTRDSSTRACR